MVGSSDHPTLRALLGTAVAPLSNLTHTVLSQAFERLGMPVIPEDAGSKSVRVEQSLQQVPDTELPPLVQRVLQQQDFPFPVRPPIRHQLEDLLWKEGSAPQRRAGQSSPSPQATDIGNRP